MDKLRQQVREYLKSSGLDIAQDRDIHNRLFMRFGISESMAEYVLRTL